MFLSQVADKAPLFYWDVLPTSTGSGRLVLSRWSNQV